MAAAASDGLGARGIPRIDKRLSPALATDGGGFTTKRIALICGINKYGGKTGFPSLRCAVADAKLVAETFEVLGFRVVLLLDEQCTKVGIDTKFEQIIEELGNKATDAQVGGVSLESYTSAIAQTPPPCQFAFYAAAHGAEKEVGGRTCGFIAPFGYNPNKLTTTALKMDKLSECA